MLTFKEEKGVSESLHIFHLRFPCAFQTDAKHQSSVSAEGPETPVTFDPTLYGGHVCSATDQCREVRKPQKKKQL